MEHPYFYPMVKEKFQPCEDRAVLSSGLMARLTYKYWKVTGNVTLMLANKTNQTNTSLEGKL